MFMPFSMSSRRISGLRLAGPMVHTIPERRILNTNKNNTDMYGTIRVLEIKISVADTELGYGAFLTPGSGTWDSFFREIRNHFLG
jgi:hypothetical protein